MSYDAPDEPSKILDLSFGNRISFEEKCWIFLKNHRKIFLYSAYCSLLIGGVIGLTFWFRDLHEQRLQKSFLTLQAPEERLLFAKKHPRSPLAGVCFLEAADQAYQASDYSQALQDYQHAQKGLSDAIFNGRAAIGYAMSLFGNGQEEEGRIALLAIAAKVRYPKAIRGEALYLAAVWSLDHDKLSKAQQYLRYLCNGDYGDAWKEEAQKLVQIRHITL